LKRPVRQRSAERSGISRDRGSSKRVAFDALRRSNWWAEIKERIQVDLVIEDSKPCAHDKIGLVRRLIGQAEARREMVLPRVEERMTAVRDLEPRAWNEVGYVPFVALHRTKILISEAIVNVQTLGYLERVLSVKVERADIDPTLWVSDRDVRTAEIAGLFVS
jgi:hypothetical protein